MGKIWTRTLELAVHYQWNVLVIVQKRWMQCLLGEGAASPSHSPMKWISHLPRKPLTHSPGKICRKAQTRGRRWPWQVALFPNVAKEDCRSRRCAPLKPCHVWAIFTPWFTFSKDNHGENICRQLLECTVWSSSNLIFFLYIFYKWNPCRRSRGGKGQDRWCLKKVLRWWQTFNFNEWLSGVYTKWP